MVFVGVVERLSDSTADVQRTILGTKGDPQMGQEEQRRENDRGQTARGQICRWTWSHQESQGRAQNHEVLEKQKEGGEAALLSFITYHTDLRAR